jgi:lipopolysaccharide transport system ATP-binding protein
MSSEMALVCQNVWKRYRPSALGIKELLVGGRKHTESKYARSWALQDVSFTVQKGTALGVVGHNGTGKSTLLSLMLQTIEPDLGRINTVGRIASLLELGAGFHPELTGRENLFLYGSILGMTLSEIHKKYNAIVDFSELGGAIESPIRTYSNGMVARLGYAVMAHAPADVLLIDEVLAVGDARFQQKCMSHLHGFKERGGTLVIVSHDLPALEQICEGAILLSAGRLQLQSSIHEVIEGYHASEAGIGVI